MPPRKKQKTDDAEPDPVARSAPGPSQSARSQQDGPRRMLTRASAKGVSLPTEASGSKPTTKATRATKPPATIKAPTAKATMTSQIPDSKALTTSKVVRSHRKGRLQTLPDLPVEIQLEIYSYLESRDLLLLSRLCKKFHAFFLTRALTKSLWAQARLNTDDIPPRPPFMSEPAFINLLYSPYCQLCGCSNVRPVWTWFLRCCVKCMQEVSFNPKDAYEYVFKEYVGKNNKRRFFFMGNMHEFVELYQRVFPVHNRSRKHWQSKVHNRIPKADLDRFIKEWEDPNGKATDKFMNPLYEDWKAFTKTQATRLQERNRWARQCEAWYVRHEDERYDALEDARRARFKDILARLKEEGWEKELEFMGPDAVEEMSEMPVIRQAAKLTPKGWEAVRKRLNDLLTETRHKRLAKEREDVIRQRCAALETAIRDHYGSLPRTADMEARPHYIDFAYSEECRTLLDAPGSDEVAPAAFAQVVPTLTERWEAEQKRELTAALEKVLPFPVPEGVDVLALAVAIIPCQCAPQLSHWYRADNTCPVRWPALLGHWCMRKHPSVADLRLDDIYTRSVMRAWTDTGRALEDETQWRVPFDVTAAFPAYTTRRAIKQACNIIEALGLDPARATIEDIQKCENKRLRCLKCIHPPANYRGLLPPDQYEAHTWMGAIRHVVVRSDWGEELQHTTWEVIEEENMALVQELESQADAQVLINPIDERIHATWCCSLCVDYNEAREPMTAHLRTVHGIEDTTRCVQDGIIFVHPTLPSKQYTIKPAVVLPVSSITVTTWTPPDATN
ncbi:hypothetical protein BD413DRAFT_155233 [Trametes elegans]|nr:hypothetical protein BD413DRAFT_155233 [Trametes elegans]